MQGHGGTNVPRFDVVRPPIQSKNKGRQRKKSRGREGVAKFERGHQALGRVGLHKVGRAWKPLKTLTFYYCMVFKYLSLCVSIYQHHSSLLFIYVYIYIYIYTYIYIYIYIYNISLLNVIMFSFNYVKTCKAEFPSMDNCDKGEHKVEIVSLNWSISHFS